jgi:hypothetical protein
MAAPEEGSPEIRKFSSVKFLNSPPFAPRQIPVLEGFADIAFSKQKIPETGRKFESHFRFLLCIKMNPLPYLEFGVIPDGARLRKGVTA